MATRQPHRPGIAPVNGHRLTLSRGSVLASDSVGHRDSYPGDCGQAYCRPRGKVNGARVSNRIGGSGCGSVYRDRGACDQGYCPQRIPPIRGRRDRSALGVLDGLRC